MKKAFATLAMAAAVTAGAFAQTKTMPIVSDEVIMEAPSGTVVSGDLRSGFSYYYSNGGVQGGFNDGFVGEYVIADDGSIYLKNACASVNLGSYIKLDKIDDENYVAHTAQLAWVDNADSDPYPYFACRVIYKKYGDYSYGYEIENDADGNPLTDIYFTYKDGILQQKDQEQIDMNGEMLPHEMLAYVNAAGNWIGCGDACITIKPLEETAAQLPEGAEVKEMSFAEGVLSSKIGKNFTNASLVKCAEVGNDFYLSLPDNKDIWLKGTIDRSAQTVSFPRQYAGINTEIGCHQWFVPNTYKTWKDVWDEETGYGVWTRDYQTADTYTCSYADGSLTSDTTLHQAGIINLSPTKTQMRTAYADFCVKPYEAKLATPADPTFVMAEEFNGLWGTLTLAIPNVDTEGTYINPDELYYNMYMGDDTKPYTFSPKDYIDLTEEVTDIPFTLNSDDIENRGAFHLLNYYDENMTYFGVQTIHKFNDEERRSDIVWYNHTPSGISGVKDCQKTFTGKRLENGQIVIVKEGRKYNVMGMPVK